MTSCSNCGSHIATGVRFCPHCGTRIVEGETAVGLVGRTLIDKYRVLSELGAGSMGKVYLAEHLGLKKKVALKVLHADLLVNEETLQRFQREGIAAGQFSHANAIQIFDFDKADGMVFLAMEYVEGATLSEYLREHGPMDADLAVATVRQVLAALSEAHARGIVHRDLKPDNIMVLELAGGGLSVKVLDFGLSKLVDRPLGASLVTQIGQIMGTPLYMAPEQAGGEDVDHRSDLYAVGLILYETVTGKPPFEGQTITELLIKQATEAPPSLFDANPTLDVPPGLEGVIRRALEKDRDARFQSAREMAVALERANLENAPPPPPRPAPPPTPEPVPEPAPRSAAPSSGVRAVLLVLASVVGLAAVGAVAMLLSGPPAGSADAAGGGGDEPLAAPVPALARVRLKDEVDRDAIEASYLRTLDQARDRLVQGSVEGARALLDNAREMPCADAEAAFVSGLAALFEGDGDLARLLFHEALEDDPAFVEPAVELGWMHLAAGERDAARGRFEAAGEDVGALTGLAALALAGEDVAGALEHATRAVALDPEDGRTQLWLGRARAANGDLEQAREALLEAKRRLPGSAEAFAELGRVYLRLSRPEDAERELVRASELDPSAVDDLAILAAARIEDGSPEDAVRLLEEPVARGGGAGPAGVAYGTALEAVGRGSEAIAVLSRALASGWGDDEAARSSRARGHVLLGALLQEAGRTREAADAYRRAVELDDARATAHLNLGLLHFDEERFGEAAEALERAATLDPELALAHYALGILYMDYLGDASTAADHLEAYRALGGDDARVGGWLDRLGRR